MQPGTTTPVRIGIFGGTFDPVHLGHLILAEQAREQAALDEVWFVPAARPPHKAGRPITPFAHRAEMLRLALAGQPAFRVDESENERPGLSYTVETLAELDRRHPGREWFLLVGSDSLADLPGWHNPVGIVRRAGLVVRSRPGSPVPPVGHIRALLRLPEGVPLRLQVVEAPLIEISSRDLRRRASAGLSLRYFVPTAVACYIRDRGLYPPGMPPGMLPGMPPEPLPPPAEQPAAETRPRGGCGGAGR